MHALGARAGLFLTLAVAGCHWFLPFSGGDVSRDSGGALEAPVVGDRLRDTPADQARDVARDKARDLADQARPELRVDVADRGVDSSGDLCPAGAVSGGAHLWSLRFGKLNTTSGAMNYWDEGHAVAVSASGDVTFVGTSASKSLWLGGPNVEGTEGMGDLIIASYTSAGVHRWSHRYTGQAAGTGEGGAVDSAGNVTVVGTVTGPMVIGGSTYYSKGGQDVFLASFDATGSLRWVKLLGGAGNDLGGAVAVDANGDLYLTGSFGGPSADFEGGPLTCAGSSDLFVASFTAAGVHRWAKGFGGAGFDDGRGLAVDGQGNLYLTGSFGGSAGFGGQTFPGAGKQDIVLASYLTASGAHSWSQAFGGSEDERATGVAVDGGGRLYVTGSFSGTLSVGGTQLTSQGDADLFVASFSSAGGTLRWAKGFGGAGEDVGEAIAVTSTGTVYLTGGVTGAVSLGGATLSASGMKDPFVASFDVCGAHRWSAAYSAAADPSTGRGVATGGGGVLVTGHYQGSINFGGGAEGSVGRDLFLIKLTP